MNHSAPILDVYGSYFPGWLVCMFIGLALAFVIRAILIAVRLHRHMRPLPLVYLAIWALGVIMAKLLLYGL